MKEVINLDELYNKEFYIVDCYDFIFFPMTARAMGYEISPDEFLIITDIEDPLLKENRRFSFKYLEKYKSFEEAKKEAERLNNLPKHKKRAEEWNNPESIYKRKLWIEAIKRSDNK